MVSWMIFHISNNNEIHKVPKSYYDDSKTIIQLSNTTILEFVLFYEVLNRKPEKLVADYANQYVLLKKIYAENADQTFYSMNKEPFVSKINTLALRECFDNLALWEKKIMKIMGYYPNIANINTYINYIASGPLHDPLR